MGRGDIKTNKPFLKILYLFLFFIYSANIFSLNDTTTDKNDKEYFSKIRENMKLDKSQTDNNKTSTDKNRSRLKIDYFSYIKIIIVLAVVIALIYGLAYFLKKYLIAKGEVGEGVTTVVSHSLTPGKWIQIVNVFGKYLVLGVTNDKITLLTEITDPKEIDRIEMIMSAKKAEEGSSFVDIISDILRGKFKKDVEEKNKFDYEEDSVDFLKKQRERIDRIKDD